MIETHGEIQYPLIPSSSKKEEWTVNLRSSSHFLSLQLSYLIHGTNAVIPSYFTIKGKTGLLFTTNTLRIHKRFLLKKKNILNDRGDTFKYDGT